jgi:hypothetical protein
MLASKKVANQDLEKVVSRNECSSKRQKSLITQEIQTLSAAV